MKNIYMIPGYNSDSNIYVIDGELMIDAGTGINFNECKNDMLDSIRIENIRRIVNTHCHFDHIGGNKKFRDWLKADIISHYEDSVSIETGANTMAEHFGQTARAITVDRTVTEGDEINTTHFAFRVLHTPGHTPGSMCLYDEDKRILISGDLLLDGYIGRTDLPTSDSNKLFDSLKRLTDIPIRCLLPGHGPPKTSGINFLAKQMMFSRKRTVFI